MSFFTKRSRTVRVRQEGPCGNTTVSGVEMDEAKRLFQQQVPAATSGLSIVQQLAVTASGNVENHGGFTLHTKGFGNLFSSPSKVFVNKSGELSTRETTDKAIEDEDSETDEINSVLPPATQKSMSQRVVNSHLEYFRKFTPFREGRFTKDTLYQFLFFAVVENRVRMSYAKRVLRTLLSYVRRYLEEKGDGTDRVVVLIENVGGESVTIDIQLTQESVAFFRNNPRGMIVRSKVFYQLMNSIGNQTNNQRLKNVVCEARRPRDLVFTEQQNATLLAFAFRALQVLVQKYMNRSVRGGQQYGIFPSPDTTAAANIEVALETFISSNATIATTRSELDKERTVFEFSVAFVIAFLTGARIKSTVMRFTVEEVDRLIRGATIEKLTKGSFARVFIPERLTYTAKGSLYSGREPNVHEDYFTQRQDSSFDPIDSRAIAKLLYGMTVVRRDPMLYPAVQTCKHVGRGGETGYGIYRQCRNKRTSSRLSDWSDSEGESHNKSESRVYRPKSGLLSVGCPYRSDECKRNSNDKLIDVRDQSFFLSSGRQLDYTFNRIFESLFKQQRPKGVFWHSQRRRYLGAVNEKCGAVTASKSVGHTDVETTMAYINKSVHREDTNRRAGSAVFEEMIRLAHGTEEK